MSVWPAIEYEDGYPVGEEEDDWNPFKDFKPSFHDAAEWLVQELPRASQNMTCFCSVADGIEKYSDQPTKVIEFSTGGWSGAESLIGLIESRWELKHFMSKWERGGHYTFEVPVKFLPQPSNRKDGEQ